MNTIPKNFEEWKNCIEHQCRIPLTKQFAKKRLNVYNNHELDETQRFIELYGIAHLNNVKEWLKRTIQEENEH